jgi:hypothetical protein
LTREDLQESVAYMLEAIFEDDCDSETNIAVNTENTANLGLNVEFMDEFHATLKIPRDLVQPVKAISKQPYTNIWKFPRLLSTLKKV